MSLQDSSKGFNGDFHLHTKKSQHGQWTLETTNKFTSVFITMLERIGESESKRDSFQNIKENGFLANSCIYQRSLLPHKIIQIPYKASILFILQGMNRVSTILIRRSKMGCGISYWLMSRASISLQKKVHAYLST